MAGGTKPAPGPLSLAVAEILRGHQARRQLTTQVIADAVGMSRSQLSNVLAGKKHVDIEQLDRICYAIGVGLEAVLKEAEEISASRHAEMEWDTPRL